MNRSKIVWFCKIFLMIVFVFLLYKFVDKSRLMYLTSQNLPPKEAALAMGLGWGERTVFDKDFKTKLKEVGIIHLVVASGTNVMLATSLLVEMLAPLLGRRWTIGLVWIWIWWYAGMVGWEAPIVRASLMMMFYYWAQFLGRKYDWKRGLVVSVLIILLIEQEFSLSLLMSVVAFLGTKIYLGKNELWRSVVVSLVLWPIMALYFGKISLIGPFMTWATVTVAEILTVGIWFLGIVGGWGLGFLYPGLRYVVWLTETVGEWKWTSVSIVFNWWMMVGVYCLMWWGWKKYENKQ